MRFSILHLSDLHRDLAAELNNEALIDSIARDIEQYPHQDPAILLPSLCIVSGDLIFGARRDAKDGKAELGHQYSQAEQFLSGLADRFFEGKRERVVIVPGNHDVSFPAVFASGGFVAIPGDEHKRSRLVAELFQPRSRLRWVWSELSFFRILNERQYLARLEDFAAMYERFYEGRRAFPMEPERQYDIFDYPDLGFSVLALNSCYDNDPFRRAGAFNPSALIEGCRKARAPERAGWLISATWHHSLGGGPAQDDYMDSEALQVLIDAGVSLGFHGHQHFTDCLDEQYRVGPSKRKITIISSSTLCAGPANLKPGVPRGYNVVELDTVAWTGRVHQRKMVNRGFDLPIWGPGHFNVTNRSYLDFDLCEPLQDRPAGLDVHLSLETADRLVGTRNWVEALSVLEPIKREPAARPLLLKALLELDDSGLTVTVLWPPTTISEAVALGAALLSSGTPDEIDQFLKLPIVNENTDASIAEIGRRLRERKRS